MSIVDPPESNATYRSDISYRASNVTYRGDASPVYTTDLDIQDYIRMEIVDNYGNHVGELNASALQTCSWVLNDVDTATIQVNKYDPGSQYLICNGPYDVRITFLNAIDYTTGLPVVWQGHPIRMQRQGRQTETNMMQLEGVFGYFKSRIVEFASMQYDSVDQFDIAWGMLEMAQTGTNYDRNVHASYQPSGYIRSRNYARDQHQKIYDILRTFRSDFLQGGFDFIFTVDVTTGQKLWVPGYPNLGQVYPGFIEWGREMVDYNLQDDGTQQATKMWAIGGGSAGVQFEEAYEDVQASSEFGALVQTMSDGAEMDVTWLQQVAQHLTVIRKIPIPNYQTLCAYSDENPILGQVRVGDMLRTRIQDGYLTNIDQQFRVQSITYQVNPGPAVMFQYYQPNLQGYTDPLAEAQSLGT